ncbi:MAG: PAS domain S-box protein [Candidatus Methanoperedens sp.]|nr:PAS domain S-box protein [Candidatus Methanoperedens sp.]
MADTKILVVEDEVIVADDIQKSLNNLGYAVPAIVSSGEAAIKKAGEYIPDLVLMDIVLQGGMDGIETAKQMRSLFDIPVIYLTAYSDKKVLEKAKITEPFGYIIKPFKERELKIALEIALLKHDMERKLKESRDWFTTALKSISDAVIATDPKGCVNFMNPAAQVMTGWELKEAEGKYLEEIFNIVLEELVAVPGSMGFEYRTILVSRNNAKIPIEGSRAPIKDDRGGVTGTVVVFRDITLRKKAEEELRRQEEHFRLLIENISDVITILKEDGTISYQSPSIEHITGYKPAELTGRNVFELVNPDDLQYVLNVFNEGIRDPQSIKTAEYRFLHKNGSWIFFESVGKSLLDNVEPGKVIVISRDITDRKRAEEALHRSEEKYRTMIENSNDMIWTLDKQGNFVYYNKRAEEVSGHDLSQWIGKSFAPLIIPQDLIRVNKIFLGTMSGKPQQYEVNIYKKDRSIRTLSVNTTPNIESGEVVGTVSFGRDITEQKRAEKIRIEKERLAEISRAKSEFLANMSHELRTPLNAIIGFSELLKNKAAGKLTEKQGHYVENVLISSKHLLSLINDILDLSKIEAGKIELIIEKVSVPEIIDVSITLINEKATKHNITLKKELDPRLDYIEADPQRFKQVLFNLLSNAVKFSKDGGTVTITAKKDGAMAEFRVRDTGIGIKEENLGKLFMAFEQLEAGISKAYEGTGLGLSITKKLVELHSGTITAESKYGEGSTFTFLLPIAQKPGKNKSYGKH